RFFALFNRGFEWTTNRYLSGVNALIRKSALAVVGLLCFWLAAGMVFRAMPRGFLPDEDQGAFFAAIRLPDGASVERTDAAARKLEKLIMGIPGVQGVLTLGGMDIATRTA